MGNNLIYRKITQGINVFELKLFSIFEFNRKNWYSCRELLSKMKILFILFFSLLSTFAFSQQEIKIFSEKVNRGYVLYASNRAYCPLTISLDLNLENLRFSKGENKIFLIPEKSEKFKIGELNIVDNKSAYKFTYFFRFNVGDINISRYDTLYEYDLPFQRNKDFILYQGYNGIISHVNDNSLDFKMDEGTEVTAAREGVVVKVVENNTESCPSEECKKFNNYIIIYHSDGTFANYVHLKNNGSIVEPGDVVKKGDLIGYSGNTGYSSGPHLHFSCFILESIEKVRTIKTKFKINDGSKTEYLQEKKIYRKDY